MPEIIINGIPVDFPFEPYDVQRTYMEKVIECLQKGINGVLESPTGTGKTLCLLCASLGWHRVKKAQSQLAMAEIQNNAAFSSNDILTRLNTAAGIAATSCPKIIYASRTHTQLSQAVNELKRTSYANTIRSAVIASRDQYCIHPEVSKETNNTTKIHMCQRYVASRSCYYYNNVESKKTNPDFNKTGISDIEDLVKIGKKHSCCPYYMSRELKSNADIIFTPYNYLLDPKARKANNIELENSIVILDEAHNIEKMCEESASLQFRSTDIALCIDEVTKVMTDFLAHTETNGFTTDFTNAAVKDFSQEELIILKTMFLELENAVDDISVGPDGSTYPGNYIFDILEKAKLTTGNRLVVQETVDKMIQYLTATSTSSFHNQGVGLQRFSELLTVVFNQDQKCLQNSVENCYKVHVTFEETKSKVKKIDSILMKPLDSKQQGRVINYWCFSSSFGMQSLVQQGVRCILLTSGTLSPIPALVSELGVKIPITLENGHVVTGDQVFISVVSSGPDGTNLNSSYNTRNDPKYIASLGRTIQNFSRVVPGGLLVFFPSYPVMKKCQDEWQATGIWPRIADNKAIFVESQTKDAFANNMADYYDKIHGDSKGACFLAVCRGKVSEGLDFSDNNGRAVIITGLPYPPLKDPRVILKQKYLDANKIKNPQNVTGQQWYQLEASRAVNQAIGRVLRHKNDFGAILLCDSRFGNPSFKQQLSMWLQPYIQSHNTFGNAYKGLIDFFKKVEITMPVYETKNLARRRESQEVTTSKTSIVASGFGQAKSRMVSRPNKPPASLSTSQITSNIFNDTTGSSDLGLSPSPKPIKSFKRKTTSDDLFSALHTSQPKSVINFNESVNIDLKLPEFTRGKKSTDNTSSRKKLVLASRNTVIKLNDTEAGPSNSVQHTQDTVALYWMKVKAALKEQDYRLFVVTIKKYNKDSNYDFLIAILKNIFLIQAKQKELLIQFKRFLKPEHKEIFDNFIKTI